MQALLNKRINLLWFERFIKPGLDRLWLIFVILCSSITLFLTPRNWSEISVYLGDRSAKMFYDELGAVVNSTDTEARKFPIFFFFHQPSGQVLEPPLDQLVIPDGVVLDYAIRFWFIKGMNIRMFQVYHIEGKYIYRGFYINGKTLDQVLLHEK